VSGRILGVKIDKYVDGDIHDLFPGLDLNERRMKYPQEITFDDGKHVKYLSVAGSVLANNLWENIGWIVSFQDVTEYRRMEEEIARNDKLAAVGKLAAGMAHEIRNPLASMSGSIQLLKNELDLEPVNKQLMEIVIRETDRLNALITDFLIFARPGNIQVELVDITLLIKETLNILKNDPLCHDKIHFEQNLADGIFCNVDPAQIRQLIWNLLKNGLQAITQGGTLKIEGTEINTEQVKGNKGILIRISDNGGGVEKEAMENIFDPFFTTKEMGSGLGLTTAFRIVENHHGRIWCQSEKGVMTTFNILLPSV